jgi:hypothetical protein
MRGTVGRQVYDSHVAYVSGDTNVATKTRPAHSAQR